MRTSNPDFLGENFMRRVTILAALLLATLLLSISGVAQDVITTAIGGGPNGIPATNAFLYQPYGVAVDSSGNFYFAAWSQYRVFKVNVSTGIITVVAGTGASGYSGDGVTGGAGNADLNRPFGVAVDSSGSVYIADQYNCVVRKVTSGTITTIAGTAGQCNGSAGDLAYPTALALDGSGDLFIADTNNCVVRKLVLSTKAISIVAGDGSCGYAGNGGKATSAELYYPQGVAVDTAGDLFISDSSNCVIREVTKSSGDISTVAGINSCTYSGDGNKATTAAINQPQGITVNGAGTIVTFADYANQRIRQFTVGGNIATVAGNGTPCGSGASCGTGVAATSAELYNPVGLAVHSNTYYIGNNDNQVVDSFTVGGNLVLAAGNYSATIETLADKMPATGVQLNYPFGIFNDSSNDVFVADSHNNMVRELVKSTGLVDYFAGDATAGYSGNSSVATDVELYLPYGVAGDSSGNVYIADTYNCLIRKVSSADAITNFAGLVVGTSATQCGFTGDGEPALSAKLNYGYGVAVDSKNNVYVADYSNHAIRKISGGVITTIAGIGGILGYSGDGGPATNALLYDPSAVAVDAAGNVFIADTQNCRVREVNASTGIITTVAGNGFCSFDGDGLATDNAVGYPQGIAVDANDNLFIGDYNDRVRWVAPNGIMTTIAGTGAGGYNGDGGSGTAAILNEPTGVTLDTAGDILFSDYGNGRVRKITVFPAVSTSTGSLSFGLTAAGSTSSPLSLSVSAYGPVTISNISTSGAFSEADDCPASMPNGTNCAMYVYFAPTASGTANGSVTVNSNGFFNQVNTVALTGLGSAISLAGSPASFGNQLVKTTSAAKVVTVKNTGTSAITMGTITSTNTTDYTISANTCPASGSTLAGAASCTISVKFNPQSTGAKRGTVVIKDSDPSSPQLVGLSGTGTSNVSLSPATVTFSTTAVTATSAATKITLTNNTGASITLGNPAVSVTGPFVNATTTTCTADLVIASTGTCVINAEFKPTVVGFASGSISVSDNDVTGSQSVALTGYGTGVKFAPGSVTFGATNIGTTVSTVVTITNVGTTPVAFTGAEFTGANSANFSDNYNDSPPCGNSSGSPLQPGKICQITIYFDPSKAGSASATYKLFDNSVGSPQTLSLKGTGQ
jgi:trimeric autotransporter adhesin